MLIGFGTLFGPKLLASHLEPNKDRGLAAELAQRSTTSLVGDLSAAGTRVPSDFVKTLTSALASSVAKV